MKSRHLIIATLLAIHGTAFAEKADRDKPMQVEAQKITVDDAKKVQTMEGNVVLIKGTLVLQSDRIVVTEDKYGFQKGTAFGGPGGLARFRQKREGKEEFVDGEAERIEYDTRNEIAELFNRAWIRSGDDQVRGDYIWYDSVAEKYLVTAQPSRDGKAQPSRARLIIQPRHKGAPPDTNAAETARKGDPLKLQGAPGLLAPPASGPGPSSSN